LSIVTSLLGEPRRRSGGARPQAIAILAMAWLLIGTLPAERANAATYQVAGCRIGWTPDVRMTSSAASSNFDGCDQSNGFGLYASFGGVMGGVNPGDFVGWRFDAPLDTTIAGLTLDWSGRGETSGDSWGAARVVLATSTTPLARIHIDRFVQTDTVTSSDAQWLRAYVECIAQQGSTCRGSSSDPGGGPDVLRVGIRRASITLVDRFAPQVEAVAGSATTDSVWNGSEPLSFSATDRGGGIFRMLIEVDGQVVHAAPAVADDRCVDATGTRSFGSPTPCPARASASTAINVADLPSGHHTVTVYLEDAAGNRAILLPPTQKLIVNDYRAVGYYAQGRFFNPRFGAPRVANGEGATGDAKVAAAFVRVVGKGRRRHRVSGDRREVRFSQRPTVRGTLTTPSGEPIANATVFVGQQPEGQQWRLDGAARTDAEGRFTYRPAARQSNRDLRVVYFPFSDSHEYVASGSLTLKVKAGLTLRVDRSALRNGQRLVFSGRVLGAVPPAGVAVTLQAKIGRHYQSFRQLRASSRTRGRVRTVYRFQRTTSTVRYRFRLKLVRQAGLPYQGGVSPTVDVLVRP
jgi:hypothetical protein